MTISPTRYQGKPLLRVLECYVLWVIGQLSEADAKTLREMAPHLHATYKLQGEWHEVIAGVMELPANMPQLVQELWVKNSEIVRKNGKTLTPQQFAEMFVDQNLVS